MGKPRYSTFGYLTVRYASTPAVDVRDLSDVIVSMGGTFTATAIVQISMDGVRWAAAPTDESGSGSQRDYKLLGPAAFVRVYCSAYTSGTVVCSLSGEEKGERIRTGTLGDLTSSAAGTAVDVSDLDDIVVTVTDGTVGTFTYTAGCYFEVSQDGTSWANGPGSASGYTPHIDNTNGSYVLAGKVKYLRAKCQSYTQGTAYVRFCGHIKSRQVDQSGTPSEQPRFGTVAEILSGTGAKATIDVSTLKDVCVTYTLTTGSATVYLEYTMGTFWVRATTFSTTNASYTFDGYVKQIRANVNAFNTGPVKMYFGGKNVRKR